LHKSLLLLFFLSLISGAVFSQNRPSQPFVIISGTVYDITARRPIEAVAVISSSGRGSLTDSLGHYSITVRSSDSIWFSLLNKTTVKYPIDTIRNTTAFDIMIHIKETDLPEVKVRNSNYHLDSLANRQDYAKYFNFKKPSLKLSNTDSYGYTPGGATVGFDLDEIVNMFRFKRTRSLAAMQRRLVQEERDKYVDHRFSKQFVRKITKLNSPDLDSFMVHYRPGYELTHQLNDLELGYYIERCLVLYKNARLIQQRDIFRRKDP